MRDRPLLRRLRSALRLLADVPVEPPVNPAGNIHPHSDAPAIFLAYQLLLIDLDHDQILACMLRYR